MSVFIDSWAWLGSLDARDEHHDLAADTFERLIAEEDDLVTTDYVLAETITRLYRRIANPLAAESMRAIGRTIKLSHIRVERISPARFEAAVALRLHYDDQPKISFTDFTTMVVMEDLGIHDILTRDNHFLSVNRGFQLLP
jgi:predicted nucleic acid-binding protein